MEKDFCVGGRVHSIVDRVIPEKGYHFPIAGKCVCVMWVEHWCSGGGGGDSLFIA